GKSQIGDVAGDASGGCRHNLLRTVSSFEFQVSSGKSFVVSQTKPITDCALYQGTTSVVPNKAIHEYGL
ncbi:MAG: hypothetical protein WCC25_27090, partial [Candidatus Korobacteraceae bacterium]